MFIQTEATPNPATLKFIPGRIVLDGGTMEFASREAAARSPLAERLFDVPGVTSVFYGADFVTVTKDDSDWQHLKPAILGAIMEHYMSGAPLLADGSAGGDEVGAVKDARDAGHAEQPFRKWRAAGGFAARKLHGAGLEDRAAWDELQGGGIGRGFGLNEHGFLRRRRFKAGA